MIKKLLYYIEISQANLLFLSKGRIENDNSDLAHISNHFYKLYSLLGYIDDTPSKENTILDL